MYFSGQNHVSKRPKNLHERSSVVKELLEGQLNILIGVPVFGRVGRAWYLFTCEKKERFVREGTLRYKEDSSMEAETWENCSLGAKLTAGEEKVQSDPNYFVVMLIYLH